MWLGVSMTSAGCHALFSYIFFAKYFKSYYADSSFFHYDWLYYHRSTCTRRSCWSYVASSATAYNWKNNIIVVVVIEVCLYHSYHTAISFFFLSLISRYRFNFIPFLCDYLHLCLFILLYIYLSLFLLILKMLVKKNLSDQIRNRSTYFAEHEIFFNPVFVSLVFLKSIYSISLKAWYFEKKKSFIIINILFIQLKSSSGQSPDCEKEKKSTNVQIHVNIYRCALTKISLHTRYRNKIAIYKEKKSWKFG